MRDLVKKDRGFFDDFLDGMLTSKNFPMKTDIKENANDYTFEIDLPGFDKKDIKINIEAGYLNISAEKEENLDEKDKKEKDKYIRRERHYGAISRSYYVGNVSQDHMKAKFKDGILSVTVPKTTEKETKYLKIE